MNGKKYNWILYLILVTIVTTIAVQLYWNYKSYQQNKQYVMNEIQESLDSSIEEYFAKLAKESLFAIVDSDESNSSDPNRTGAILESFFSSKKKEESKQDSTYFKISSFEFSTDNSKEFKQMDSVFFDSLFTDIHHKKQIKNSLNLESAPIIKISNTINDPNVRVYKGKKATDSIRLIKGLQTIFISVKNDTLNHKSLDSIINKSLVKKGIHSSFYLTHVRDGLTIFSNKKKLQTPYKLSAHAKSTFLKFDESLSLFYSNPSYEALKRSSTGIFLSLVLSLSVIASLFYLLNTINKQKELAEIKNDLISNITHEFKTPITTISTAIEAIDSFNMIDDKEKTKKYLTISSNQLKKLYLMVEKLLETATLDSEKLLLKKEDIDMVELIERIAKKHQLLTTEKTISFTTNIPSYSLNIDVFHFENAISNLIDNAVKYGGNAIEVNVNAVLNNLHISIADNGNGIEKNQQERIFDKFYRVPKGNTHDVKGFGIGLYYTKIIIEKHGGAIEVSSNNKLTIFKISIPNEQ